MCRAACRRRSSRWKTPFNLYSIRCVKFHISCVARRASSAPGALVLRALLQRQLLAHRVSKCQTCLITKVTGNMPLGVIYDT